MTFRSAPLEVPVAHETEDEIVDQRKRIARMTELSFRQAKNNPSLALRCALRINDQKEAEQIALAVAKHSPKTILENLDLIRGRSWAMAVEGLAHENSTD